MRKALLFLMLLALAWPVQKACASEGGEKEKAASHEGGEKKEGGKKDDKKKATHKITQSESYMMIEPFYASIIDGTHPQGLLMVGIGLDVPDPKMRERIDSEMPRLRDAYVRSLMAFSAIGVRSYRQPDVADMADRLQAVTDRYLAKKGAAKVLLAQVMIRLNK